MKQAISDKYTIAWFTIAQCVARKEKERALGVYRLLSHSFDDLAFARQLEGDIFLSFNDTDIASEKYEQAVELYKKSNRLRQAAAVYEHLLTIHPHNKTYRADIIELYDKLGMPENAQGHARLLNGLRLK